MIIVAIVYVVVIVVIIFLNPTKDEQDDFKMFYGGKSNKNSNDAFSPHDKIGHDKRSWFCSFQFVEFRY